MNWTLINSFADWFSAFGTIAAVVVSLHLARRDNSPRLKIFAGHRLLVQQGVPNPENQDYLVIGVTNVGLRDVQVTNIGWKIGVLRKQFGIQTIEPIQLSSTIPTKLSDGEEARYLIPLFDGKDWAKRFYKDFLAPNPRVRVRLTWLQVHTSVGKTFKARIEPGLQRKILELGATQQSAAVDGR